MSALHWQSNIHSSTALVAGCRGFHSVLEAGTAMIIHVQSYMLWTNYYAHIPQCCQPEKDVTTAAWVRECHLQRAGYSARLEEDGICNCIGVWFSKELFLLIERLVQHQFLSAILLIFGTIRVRRTVWTNINFLLGDRYEPGVVYCWAKWRWVMLLNGGVVGWAA